MINSSRKDGQWGSRLGPKGGASRSLAVVKKQFGKPTRKTASRYEELKAQIQGWWAERWKIGEALKEIHTDKLYKKEYATFQDFCESEFGLKRQSAYMLMDFAEVRGSLQNVGLRTKLSNETQAQVLSRVPVEQRHEVMETVIKSGRVTAKSIREAATSKGAGQEGILSQFPGLGAALVGATTVIDVVPSKPTKHCRTCTC